MFFYYILYVYGLLKWVNEKKISFIKLIKLKIVKFIFILDEKILGGMIKGFEMMMFLKYFGFFRVVNKVVVLF